MFLADDALRLHESARFNVARFFNLDNLARNKELSDIAGQASVLVIEAMVFFGLLVAIYSFGNKEFRRVSRSLFLFLAIFAFFAIVVDAVHAYVKNDIYEPILAVIEGGGEIVTTSFIVWYLFGLVGKSWDKDVDGGGALNAINPQNGADRLLILLLSTTAFLVVLDIFHSLIPVSIFTSPFFSLKADRGFSEVFLYSQYYLITLLFVLLAFQRKTPMMVFWSLVFIYFLLDDILLFHEKGGAFISTLIDFGPLAYGSLGNAAPAAALYYLLVGGLIVVFAFEAYRLGNREFKRVSKPLVVLLAWFAFFAVGVDVINHGITQPFFSAIADIIEEGGEIVTISLITRYVFALTSERQAGPASNN